MNALIETLNLRGEQFVSFAWPMMWQSSVLIALLFAFDFAFRRKMCASVRYALWLVVLFKLLLPPSLALPTSLAWWVRPSAPPSAAPKQEHDSTFVISYSDVVPTTLPMPVATRFEPPLKQSLSPGGWAALTWAVVCAGLLAWLLGRWRQVARDVRRATFASERLRELLKEAQSATRISRSIELRLTTRAMSPAVCGLFHPVILLPQSLVARLTSEQLRAVLLHEMIHLRRGDVWVNCLQAMLQIFYWWHPLLWLANDRIRRVREEAVDDAGMLALADVADAYAPTLIEVAKLALNRPLASLGLVGILESRSALRQRIERLVDFCPTRKAGLTFASGVCVFAFAALAVPMEKAPVSAERVEARTATDLPQPGPEIEPQGGGAASTRDSVERINIVTDGGSASTNLISSKAERLYTRTFKFDANRFYTDLVTQGFLAAVPAQTPPLAPTGPFAYITSTNFSQTLSIAVQKYFLSLGVNLDPELGKAIFWSDRSGMLYVRGTMRDLDTIDEALREMLAVGSEATPAQTNHTSNTRLRGARPEAAGLIQDGRGFLEAGKLDEAEAELNKALTVDPNNRTANYYLSLVQERRALRRSDGLVAGIASLTNGFLTALPHDLSYDDKPGVPLSLSRKVGLLYQVEVREDGSYRIGATPVTLLELKASLAETKQAYPDVAVHLNTDKKAPLKSIVTLVELLKELQITSITADTRGGNPTNLYNRNFKVDANALQTNLRKQGFLGGAPTEKRQGLTRQAANTNSTEEVTEAMRKFFSKAGVSLDSPRSLSFNDQDGNLVIRATMQEFTIVEQALPLLSENPKPQIRIEARFVEITRSDSRALDSLLGNVFTQDGAFTNFPPRGLLYQPGVGWEYRAEGRLPPQSYGILPDPQYRVVLRAFEQRPGVDLLSAPRVTTLSGRQAQIQSGETRTVVTGLNPQALIPPGITGGRDATNQLYHTNSMRFGPVLDVTPTLSADGHTVSLRMNAAVTEFLGYDENTNFVTAYINGRREQVARPLPRFRVRETSVTANVWDGQTVVLLNPVEFLHSMKPNGDSDAREVTGPDKKPLVVFVTVRLVDELGNPIHADEEMPFAYDSIPPQTSSQK